MLRDRQFLSTLVKIDKRFGKGGKITKISGLTDITDYIRSETNTIKYYNDRIRFIQLGNRYLGL